MTAVPRHAIDVDHAWSRIESLSPEVAAWLDRVPDNPRALTYLRDTTLALAGYRCVVDPAAVERETWEDLSLAAQASAAVFAGPAGETVEVRIGRTVRYPALGPITAANAGAWLSAAWLAAAVGDDELVDRLCEVTPDTLRATGVAHDSYLYPWVASTRAFLRREDVPPEMFIPAINGADPGHARHTPPDAMVHLVHPPILMFYYLLRRDADKFNAALAQALDSHRKWWTTDADRATDPAGFMAIQPLGIAVLAREVGLPMTVTSDYLPENLLYGHRPG